MPALKKIESSNRMQLIVSLEKEKSSDCHYVPCKQTEPQIILFYSNFISPYMPILTIFMVPCIVRNLSKRALCSYSYKQSSRNSDNCFISFSDSHSSTFSSHRSPIFVIQDHLTNKHTCNCSTISLNNPSKSQRFQP